MTAVENRLRDALYAGVSAAEESPDLFASIQLSNIHRRADSRPCDRRRGAAEFRPAHDPPIFDFDRRSHPAANTGANIKPDCNCRDQVAPISAELFRERERGEDCRIAEVRSGRESIVGI